MRTQAFMGVDLEVAPGALVPREETELLGRTAVDLVADLAAPRILDMCCGSGNLACGIASAVPTARMWGADLTSETVALARRNVERLGLADRVTIAQGDLFAALDGLGLEGGLDLIVANPPYISTARLEGESAHLLDAEPREAFDGGPYGIAIHQRLVREAAPFLVAGGRLAFEFGAGQERQVAALVARAKAWEPMVFVQDAGGLPRVAVLRKPSTAL